MTRPALLHHIFAVAAQRSPHRTAVDVPPAPGRPERRLVSYADLARASDNVAHVLKQRVTAPDTIVVVLLPRINEQLYVAQLAVLKAGAAFTCIDPSFPDGQVHTILMDSQAAAILSDAAGVERLRRLDVSVPVLEVGRLADSGHDDAAEVTRATDPVWQSPDRLAYLIYTSGTTGRPKGVMIEHRSIVNLVLGDLDTLGVTPEDRVVQSSSPSYDSSIEETWFALAAGATVVVMDDEAARRGPDLVEWLRCERITMFCPAPTLLRSTGCDDPRRELPALRLLHPGGEALPQDVADLWASGRRLVNDYGPTEATITALRGPILPGEPVSIGRPVPGMQAWILDEHLEELPVGARGELCLGGIGLARGYRNEPALTARKFVEHPRLGRIYRTGDVASRDADGRFSCHGRIDAQVKVRGYRIELEAVEARLVECDGVREAACTVQGEGGRVQLVAFVVAAPGVELRSFDPKEQLKTMLPEYMVPAHIGLLPRLPRTSSGKLDRRSLPTLDVEVHELHDDTPPAGPLETVIGEAFQAALGLKCGVSVHDDFFNTLGGDSLAAAVLVSLLRHHPETASLTVRDLYEARTVAALADRVVDHLVQPSVQPETAADSHPGNGPVAAVRPILATVQQAAVLLVGLLVAAPLSYLAAFWLIPSLIDHLGLVPFVLLAPALYLAGLLVYTALTVALAAVVKRCLIGTYRPMHVPVWSNLYVRNWIVQRCVRLIPWRFIEITEVQNAVLRRLGARIGRRVHLHRGVNLTQGGWDLLDVGDDVTVGQDAALQIAALHAGHLTFGHVSLGRGATLEVRAGVAPDTRVGTEASLAPWSYLASGGEIPPRERWDGVPAKPAGRSPTIEAAVSPGRTLTPAQHAAAMLAGRAGLTLVATLPWQVMALGVARTVAPDGADVWEALLRPAVSRNTVLVELALVAVALPLTLLSEAVALRLLGRVRPGVISRWSLAYVRVRLKTETLESAGRWLCGTRLWPVWLRIAGMRLGRDCEISTIIDSVPELVDIGPETFFADGILLGGPHISRGSVTLAPVRLDTRVFLGNHAVVAGGQQIPSDVLIGVCTVADDRRIRPGTSWFGQPPFQLHNREPVTCDRRLTHEPDWLRYVNRLTWEGLRFAIPLIPVVIGLEWLRLLASLATVTSWPVLLFGLLPLLDAAASVAPLALVLVTKWVLLGRVRPGRHPLWSCWCSRWDFLYVLWDFCAVPTLAFLEGSLLLNAYLRAMGVRLGRRVVLGPNLTQVADPDLLDFEDDATVDCLLQAHTFEDRVLKMDRVTVRRAANVGHAALLLYGADVGERTAVMPHSVVMKGERLPANQVYAGRPTRRSSALSAAFVGGPVSALVDQTGAGHAAAGVGT